MTTSRLVLVTVAGLVVVAGLSWFVITRVSREGSGSTAQAPVASTPATPAPPGRKIKARLFYVADDGARLIGQERDVPFGEGVTEQARHIIEAQVAPAAEPFISAVPPGTMLRALFVTERGEAFVDLSKEVVSRHTGGSTNEALTVYTLVDALTANLPAIQSVQILVDGKQVETLAGHIDLRRPIEKNLAWIE
jgi:Sporulation and spore germination